MFMRYGHFIVAHRRLVALGSLATLVLAIVAMATVAPSLESDGFVSEDAESLQVARTLEDQFGTGGPSLILLFDADRPVDDPAVQDAVDGALAPLASEPQIVQVLTAWSIGNPELISTDGQSTYVVVVGPGEDLDEAAIERLDDEVSEIAEANGLRVTFGGSWTIGPTITSGVEEGLIRAETVAIPLTLVIQILVFGSLLAAGVPLLIGIIAIVTSIALIFVLSTDTFQSVFAVNIITMLGLGLGIDYSLFMVSRFREELALRPVAGALAVTMATVGKAILFSGITVIFGLAATQFFPVDALQSMGQAGMVVTGLTLLYGLTLLPALLAMLGPRINAIRIGRRRSTEQGAESAFWHRIASFVMRYPVRVLVPVLILLLVAGIPILRLDLTPGGPEVLPEDTASRQVFDRLTTDFAAGNDRPVQVLVRVADGDPTSPANIAALTELDAELRALPSVVSVASFLDPGGASDAAFDWSTWARDPEQLPAPLAAALERDISGDLVHFEVTHVASGAELDALVHDVRDLTGPGLTLQVGGLGAESVDTIDGITSGLVPATIFVLVGSYLILLLTFGSVLLPLKAIFMTLLSISASLGAVVWIFQDGNLQSLFGFTASGELISTTPILMFCILFGLSMDYEVLMLSRIQEEYERTGDNRASVAFGLAHTATVITGAAAIMVVVFGGFILADIVIIKSMGFGLALAVLIDATIVRGLLVPATMRLMGRWNWWAPARLRRMIDRLGLTHRSVTPDALTGD